MNNPETGYDDPNINNNGGNAGYPEFSAVHEYPKVDKLVPRGNQFQQKKIEPQKIQAQKKQTKTKKKKKIKPMFVPTNQIYMDQEGKKYMAVPVGKPKLVPVAVNNPTPMAYAPYNAYPNAYPNTYPNYNGAYYQQPQAYAYYPPPPRYGMGYYY